MSHEIENPMYFRHPYTEINSWMGECVCCAISDNGISNYILCPQVQPKSCPGKSL